MNVIITSPSLNPTDNVGGISNLTRLLIEKNKTINYKVFILGKKDREIRGLFWLFKQILIPIKYFFFLKRSGAHLVHLNIPLMSFALVRDYMILLITLLLKKPVIIHIRGGRFINKQPANRLVVKFIKHLLDMPERVLVLSKIEKEKMCKYYPGTKKEKIVVLPNAVEVTSNGLSKKYKDKIKLLFLGRIDKTKGFPEIEKTLNKLIRINIDFQLSVCGEGPYREEFVNKLNSSLKAKVIYKGVVSGNEKDKILQESHIFLLPSYFPEGLPNALLEAMGAGLVPICTPIGSIPCVISDKVNGFIIPFHDEESIVEILITLNNDRDLMKKIGNNAHVHIKENYSIDNYIDRLNNIYEEVLS